MQYVSEPLLSVAENLLEVDVVGDRKYAGWSPGSVSLTGFARDATFWKRAPELEKRAKPPSWQRVTSKQLHSDFIDKRWKKLVEEGLGDDFTGRVGYEQVRELIGPSEYVLKNIHFQRVVKRPHANDTPGTHGWIQRRVSSCDIRSPTYLGP